MKNLNVKIIDEISKRLPGEKKPVSYLMDLLCIGKESAYRRLKDQIPFTFEEIGRIAENMNFSIDQILGYTTDRNIFFNTSENFDSESPDAFYNSLICHCTQMEELLNMQNVNIKAVLNRIPVHFFPFKNLFKFDYCRYLHSNGKIPLMTRFSDIKISPMLSELHQKIVYHFNRLPGLTCIVGEMTYNKLIKEIEYYYHLKFLSNEDLNDLQTELLDMMKMYEVMLRTGQNNIGTQYTFYYSIIDFDVNVFFLEFDEKNILMIPIFTENPLAIVNNKLVYEMFTKWFHSQIRNSILISKTDNITHTERLVHLYDQISNITKQS